MLKNKQKMRETAVLIGTFLFWTASSYWLSKLITRSFSRFDMTTALDENIPFVPWTVAIYFGCFLFWVVNIGLCCRHEEEERNRFFCADALGKIISLLIFILIPTTNIRPEISDDPNLANLAMRFLYWVDSADNLFPSLHCFESWLCWIGIRNHKEIPLAYRVFSLLLAIAVCISTLTTKQHVVVDVFAGIFLAEFSHFIAGFAPLRRIYGAFLSKLLSLLFKEKQKPES